MNEIRALIPAIITGFLYGSYDTFIKLSSQKIDSSLGSLIVQIFSVLTIIFLIFYQKLIMKTFNPKVTRAGILLSGIAGALIGLALVSLFLLLSKREAKVIIALPTILLLRYLTVVLIGVFVLKESLSLIKVIGILFSLLSLYLLTI